MSGTSFPPVYPIISPYLAQLHSFSLSAGSRIYRPSGGLRVQGAVFLNPYNNEDGDRMYVSPPSEMMCQALEYHLRIKLAGASHSSGFAYPNY